MRTEAQRHAAYLLKTVPATVSLKVAAVLGGMKTGFSAAINDLVPIEQATQGVLNDADVPTVQYPFYLNFAREIWARKFRGIDGPTLISSAQSLHDKYVSYGLATAVLVDIADQVFTITVT
jgi:hypothetical protein